MADIQQPKPKKSRNSGPIHRVRLKDGHHVEFYPRLDESGKVIYPVTGETIMFNRGDVFLSVRPLYRRDPNKYEFVDDHTPLSGGNRFLEETFDPDFDDDGSTVPTVPMSPQVRAAQQPAPPKEVYDPAMLEAMTANELKSLAEAEEIDLGNAKSRTDIIAAIKRAKSM